MKLLFPLACFVSIWVSQGTASSYAFPVNDEALPGYGKIRSEAWFLDVWEERRSKFATQIEHDFGSVVFLGDSILQSWGDGLASAFSELKVCNRGIDGDTTRGLLIRIEEDVFSVFPSAVVLLIGTNDLFLGVDAVGIAENMRLLLERIQLHNSGIPIVLCEVFPSTELRNRPAQKIKKLNELYRSLANESDQVTLLETYGLFAGPDGNAKRSEFPDLLHPNELGYGKWAAALRPILMVDSINRAEKPGV